jgi:hypothetical protein
MMSASLSPYIAPAEDHADMLWRCCNVLVLAFEWLVQQQAMPKGAGDVCICSLSLVTFAYFVVLVNPPRLCKSIWFILQDAHFQLTTSPHLKDYTTTKIQEMENNGELRQYGRFLWDKWKPDQLFCLVSFSPKLCVQSVIDANAKKVEISDYSMATGKDHGAAFSKFIELLAAKHPASIQSLYVTPDTPLPFQKLLRSKNVDLSSHGSLQTMDAISVVAVIKHNVRHSFSALLFFKSDHPLFTLARLIQLYFRGWWF